MGLDGVELVMEFEDEFGIDITDEEAVGLRTPGMVIDLVLSKLEVAAQEVCWSQRAFYLLRGALMEYAGAARGAIRPDSALQDLIHPEHVARMWPTLEQAVEAKVWPGLVRAPLLVAGLWAVGCAACLGMFVIGMAGGVGTAASSTAVGAIIFAIVAILVTERWRTRLPQGMERVRDLVPYAGTSERIAWTREKVATVVKVVVVEQLGLSEADYREDADFINDLGMG